MISSKRPKQAELNLWRQQTPRWSRMKLCLSERDTNKKEGSPWARMYKVTSGCGTQSRVRLQRPVKRKSKEQSHGNLLAIHAYIQNYCLWIIPLCILPYHLEGKFLSINLWEQQKVWIWMTPSSTDMGLLPSCSFYWTKDKALWSSREAVLNKWLIFSPTIKKNPNPPYVFWLLPQGTPSNCSLIRTELTFSVA